MSLLSRHVFAKSLFSQSRKTTSRLLAELRLQIMFPDCHLVNHLGTNDSVALRTKHEIAAKTVYNKTYSPLFRNVQRVIARIQPHLSTHRFHFTQALFTHCNAFFFVFQVFKILNFSRQINFIYRRKRFHFS